MVSLLHSFLCSNVCNFICDVYLAVTCSKNSPSIGALGWMCFVLVGFPGRLHLYLVDVQSKTLSLPQCAMFSFKYQNN